jgi:two-component system chemotaxis response regulator CheB
VRAILIRDADDDGLAITRWLEHDGDIEVVIATAPGPEPSRRLGELHPDLMIVSGQAATAEFIISITAMLRPAATAIVALTERVSDGPSATLELMSAGAAEVLPMSQLRINEPGSPQAVALRHRMRRHVRSTRRADNHRPVRVQRSATGPAAVGICASTGGPNAIEQVLQGLPDDYPLPILVVQHIADGFMQGFVEWLRTRVRIPVAVADDGMDLKSGAWFAPDDADLVVLPSLKLTLEKSRQHRIHRPSADALLESMAEAIGRNAIGVVLTGMGRDGGDGVAALRQQRARVIAQDEASSVIFGMPRTAIERGAQLVLPLSQIAPELVRIAQEEIAG